MAPLFNAAPVTVLGDVHAGGADGDSEQAVTRQAELFIQVLRTPMRAKSHSSFTTRCQWQAE